MKQIEAITKPGEIGDGEILLGPLIETIRIRTSERGKDAV